MIVLIYSNSDCDENSLIEDMFQCEIIFIFITLQFVYSELNRLCYPCLEVLYYSYKEYFLFA